MKKTFALLLAVLLAFTCIDPVMALQAKDTREEPEQGIKVEPGREDEYPDADSNGYVDREDAIMVLSAVVGFEYPNLNFEAGDIDHDGRLTSYDAYLILAWLAENGPGKTLNTKRTIRDYDPFTRVPFEVLITAGNKASIRMRNTGNITNGYWEINLKTDAFPNNGNLPPKFIIFYCGYIWPTVCFKRDYERGVITFAFARLEPVPTSANPVCGVILPCPYSDTTVYAIMHELNENIDFERSQSIQVLAQ